MWEAILQMGLPLLFGGRWGGNTGTPTQQSLGSGDINGLGRTTNEAYRSLLSNYDPNAYAELYKNSFLNPVKRSLQQDILPSIRNQFLGGDELGSSALNQALSRAIEGAASRLGEGMYAGYQTHTNNVLQALSQLASLSPNRGGGYRVGGLLDFLLPLGQRLGERWMEGRFDRGNPQSGRGAVEGNYVS